MKHTRQFLWCAWRACLVLAALAAVLAVAGALLYGPFYALTAWEIVPSRWVPVALVGCYVAMGLLVCIGADVNAWVTPWVRVTRLRYYGATLLVSLLTRTCLELAGLHGDRSLWSSFFLTMLVAFAWSPKKTEAA